MEKKSLRKLSLLGLVLMGASALTAAIVPSKAADIQGNSADNGTLRPFSADNGVGDPLINSCVNVNPVNLSCHFTSGTLTSGAGIGTRIQTVGGHRYQTVGNTSNSDGDPDVDTTSILAAI